MKKQNKNAHNTVVIYHRNCLDGFAGAWAAWKTLGDEAEYLPAAHQTFTLAEPRGKTVYFVDFSYRPDVMERLAHDNPEVIVIDHHETVETIIPLVSSESIIDSTRSGSVLAWRYFHPGEAVPNILAYIEDEDLWQWKLPHAKEVALFLEMEDAWRKGDFHSFDRLAQRFENPDEVARAEQEGAIAFRYKQCVVDAVARRADFVSFEGRTMLAVNTPVLSSEVGNALCVEYPPVALMWYERRDGVRVSLRSDGSVNVADIAKKYGGGGHRAAAGFKLPLHEKLPWEYLSRPPAGSAHAAEDEW